MTLEGAINLSETNDYIVYTMNSVTTGQYGVVVPKNIMGTLNMLVDLHMKSSFDGVINGSKTKDGLVSEITEEYTKLKSKYVDGMLVMPMIDEVEFSAIVNNSDKQKMFDEVKKIGAITSELYKKLTEQGIDKQKIDQKIIIVEKSLEDERFVNWLKEQSNMANFVDGFKFSDLNPVQEVVSPFTSNNNIFDSSPVQQEVVTPVVQEVVPQAESVVQETVNVGGIFDNQAPTVAPVAPVVEPVVASAPVMPEQPPVMQSQTVTPVVEPVVTPTPSVDLFGQNTSVASAPVQSAPAQPSSVQAQPSPAPVTPEQQPVQQSAVEGPKPVDAAMLEGTIAFTPIPNHPNNQVEGAATDNQGVVDSGENKSKGFVNLLIIVVILAVVTFISIELGKYLYGIYGA